MVGTMKLKTILVITTAACALACAQGDVEPEGAANGPLEEHSFHVTQTSLLNMGTHERLMVDGTVGDYDATLFVDLAGVQTGVLSLDGETWFANASSANFEAHPAQSGAVLRAWMFGTCAGCPVSDDWQMLTGQILVDQSDNARFAGRLDLVLEGRIPAFPSATGAPIRLKVTGEFGVDFAPAAVDPTVGEPKSETSQTETPAVGGPTETVGAPETSPTADWEGPAASPVSDVFEVTLFKNQGVNFSAGEVVNKGNFANSDLYATAGKHYLKLSPGGNTSTKGRPLRWFQNSGGFVQTFDSVQDVPLSLPTDADSSKSIVNAKSYIGFVVKNHLSDDYTRVWIKHGNEDYVTLQFQLVVPAQ